MLYARSPSEPWGRAPVPNSSPPGAEDTTRMGRDGTWRWWRWRGQPEPRVGRILPPCPENKGLRCRGSGGHLISSRTRGVRAAELPPGSRGAGMATALL